MSPHRFGATVSTAALVLAAGCLPCGYSYHPAQGHHGPSPGARRTVGAPAGAEASRPGEREVAAAPAVATAAEARPGGRLVAGLSGGFMISDGIGPGGDLVFTYRLDDFVGIRFSVGRYSLGDEYREESVTPILVRAVFATPMACSSTHRSFVGIGAGLLFSEGGGSDHDYMYYPPVYAPAPIEDACSEETVYLLEWGRECVMEDSRRARVQVGLLLGDRAEGVSFSFGMDFGG
ncbi:MAG: hypothetical protein ACYS9X_04300 [Planctomycetota bacterium]|jgi:hypothetical protein